MSKCIICGRELTSGEPPEMYNNMCLKCYQEQNYAECPFKQGVIDYQKQLKAKDKKWNYLQKWLESEINNCYHEIENYKGTDINHSVPYYQKLEGLEIVSNKMNELEIREEINKPKAVYKAESVDIEDVWEFDYENNKGE